MVALYWDGMLMKDVTGKKEGNEAILVSGAPHYLEGKILAFSLGDEGNPTSTEETQSDDVLEQREVWEIKENIVALVFDTTGNNTEIHRGAIL